MPFYLRDRDISAVRAHFSEAELVNLSLVVVAINGWNRLMIAFRAETGHSSRGHRLAQP